MPLGRTDCPAKPVIYDCAGLAVQASTPERRDAHFKLSENPTLVYTYLAAALRSFKKHAVLHQRFLVVQELQQALAVLSRHFAPIEEKLLYTAVMNFEAGNVSPLSCFPVFASIEFDWTPRDS